MLPFYVPRDEDFSEIKQVTFGATTLYSVLHGIVPTLESVLTDTNKGFSLFKEIESLYENGVDIEPSNNGSLLSALPRLVKAITGTAKTVLQFETPRVKDSKKNISTCLN